MSVLCSECFDNGENKMRNTKMHIGVQEPNTINSNLYPLLFYKFMIKIERWVFRKETGFICGFDIQSNAKSYPLESSIVTTSKPLR